MNTLRFQIRRGQLQNFVEIFCPPRMVKTLLELLHVNITLILTKKKRIPPETFFSYLLDGFDQKIEINKLIDSLDIFFDPKFNKTKDWALVQNAALVIDIKVLKLG